MREIYMDANATTPLDPEVAEAMRPYFFEEWGNASSIHRRGQRARAAVERARAEIAALLHCRPSEVVITSSGTEADNLALFGLVRPGDHLIVSSIEHHAVKYAAGKLEKHGVAVSFLPVDSSGVVDSGEVRKALRPETRLISVMLANNETGAIQPVTEIGRIAAEADVYFHTDAVQAAGKLPLDVAAFGCDLMTVSAHKIYGPQGVGALYVRRGTPLEPMLVGGGHERRRRAGTENVAGIVGFGFAARLAMRDLESGSLDRVRALRDRLERGILAEVDAAGVHSSGAMRVPNTANFWFDRLEGEALVISLDLKGVAVSGGAACASGSTEPSHVLMALGDSADRARASIRFSLHKRTTQDEVDAVIALVPREVSRLRKLAPVNARLRPAPQSSESSPVPSEREIAATA